MRISDWSSDVCSSDLRVGALAKGLVQPRIEATRAVVEERDTLGGAVIRRRAGRKRRGLAAIEAVIEPARQLAKPVVVGGAEQAARPLRSEEHTSELQSLMSTSYAVFCLKKKNTTKQHNKNRHYIITTTQTTK